jgi:hypothetical protein
MTDPTGLLLRDCRRRGHFTIDNELIDDKWLAIVGVNAFAVYSVICRHADINTSSGFPGIPRIVDLTGLSRAEVIRCLKRLEDTRLISIPVKGRGRGHKSEMYLLDKSLWKLSETYQPRQARKDKGCSRSKGILEIPITKGILEIPFDRNDKNEQEKVSNKYLFEQEKVSNDSIKGISKIHPLSLYKETNKETIILIETADRSAKNRAVPQDEVSSPVEISAPPIPDPLVPDYASLAQAIGGHRDETIFPQKKKYYPSVGSPSEQETLRRQELLRQAQILKGA